MTFGLSVSGDGIQPATLKEALSYDSGYTIIIDEAFGVVTNQLLTIGLPITGLKGIVAWATGQNVKVETNDSTTPDQTWDFVADAVGILWTYKAANPPMVCPISDAITALYFTTTVTGGSFKLRALYNL